jgi:hypothetical protein
MSVFLHITDEQRFGQAFANLARLLRPGGHAVLIEAVLVHGWHGEPWGPEATSKARPVADYRAAIDAAGLDLVDLRPATVVLANPTDTRSRLAHGLAVRAWAVLQLGVGTDERRGRVAAAVLSAVDAPLRRLLPNGPSAKLLLLRRR